MQEEVAKNVFENISDFNKIAFPLIILLSMNLLAFIGKYIADYILKNKDVKIHKMNLISAKRIDVQEQLYYKLESLSLYSQDQKDILLEAIQTTEQYLNHNKLFIDKKIFSQSNKILDYYKTIYFNFRLKKYEQENELIDGFYKLFNK